jgi:hypothetical protein
MRLAKLSKFREMFFAPGSAPSLNTLRKRIHDIPGGTIFMGQYYIDLDEFDRAHHVRERLRAEQEELEKDPLLKGLI